MIGLIESYVKNLTENYVFNFARKENINLNKQELSFVYAFIKNNYEELLEKGKDFDINKYQNRFTQENFNKIKQLIIKYSELL